MPKYNSLFKYETYRGCVKKVKWLADVYLKGNKKHRFDLQVLVYLVTLSKLVHNPHAAAFEGKLYFMHKIIALKWNLKY